ncbi:SMP-30/gluconolactonase/LRE family protein [uncultured Tateyamaria sp.]|uniref:SMP-30/gluconolactonase/LRE family protein n=1 Tax=Tateyamaria sp. 1078 TaxID=3417464 RepID=UPI00260C0870|nr:SMP-30/gluconolactonase/LRE family protein [uncultured Tateyamaria sp.]
MSPMFSIDCLITCENHLGEGPVWDCETGMLYWVDSTGPRVGKDAIWRFDPASGAVTSWPLSKDVGAMALRQKGGAVLALSDGFYAFDFDTGAVDLIAGVDDDPTRARLNDGKCDRMGRFFAGGMDDKEELGICGLWRLDPDLSLHKIEDGIICSNGPCWSPDDRTFYFADTFKNEIWAYDYDLATGTPDNKRVFASTAKDAGFADGSTVDDEGFLWNAQVISGDLIRYAPDGSVDRKISMPVRNITSVMFGGPDLTDIYVTSMARVSHPAAHDGFAKQSKPQFGAGSLFRIRGLGIKGVPEPRFAG